MIPKNILRKCPDTGRKNQYGTLVSVKIYFIEKKNEYKEKKNAGKSHKHDTLDTPQHILCGST